MAGKKKYYPVTIWFEDGVYYAEIVAIPRCLAHGDTPDEAYKNVQREKDDWIKLSKELGNKIPEPFGVDHLRSLLADYIAVTDKLKDLVERYG